MVQVEAVGTGGSHDGGVGDGGQVVAAHTAGAGGSQADGQQGGLIIPVKHGADQGDHDADGTPGGTGGEADEAGHDEDHGRQELGQAAGAFHNAADEVAYHQAIVTAQAAQVQAKHRIRMGEIIWMKPLGMDSMDLVKPMRPRSQ